MHDEAVTVRDDDGRPLYVQGYLLDVSERRHAGEERAPARGGARRRRRGSRPPTEARRARARGRDPRLLAELQATLRRVADLCAGPGRLVSSISSTTTARRPASQLRTPAPACPTETSRGPPREPEILEVAQRGKPELTESRICIPLRARGRTLGALTLITRAPGRSYGADDFAVAQDLAGMTALAIDNAA